jgi:glyoxylate reductase
MMTNTSEYLLGETYTMKVFVTRAIPTAGIQFLRKHCTVEINPYDRQMTKQEIIQAIHDKDGLLCLLTDPIDKDILLEEPQLKAVANYAVGYDNIDVFTATKHGIAICNTPGVLTDTTAELAWALVFSVTRRVVEADRFSRAGRFKGWEPLLMLGTDITNKTLGIVGTGRIGTAMALKSRGFDMHVIYYDNNKNSVLENTLNATKVSLDTLIRTADIISIHLPLTKHTHHLIGKKELQSMKKTTVLINTARGSIIEEKALIKALEDKWIFGAGLDVYEYEPAISPELMKQKNVVLLPHIGSATMETRSNMAVMAAQNLLTGMQGKQPPNCVNPEIYTQKK